ASQAVRAVEALRAGLRHRVLAQRRIGGRSHIAEQVHPASSANERAAASSVSSSCSSPCASEGNQASYCEGGRYTPWSSIERQKAAWASMSQALTDSRSETSSPVKIGRASGREWWQ